MRGVPWRVRFAYKKSIKHLSREDMIEAYIYILRTEEKRRKKSTERITDAVTTAIYDTKHRGEDH